MRSIVMLVFWLEMGALAITLGRLAFSEYPRVEDYGRGFDTIRVALAIAFAAWCASVLWGGAQ